MKKGYKFRIYPDSAQRDLLEKSFGCARFVYNYFLADNIEQTAKYKSGELTSQQNPSSYALSERLPSLKNEFEFLSECIAVVLQQSVADLACAYRAFFKGLRRYPKFKSKRNRQSMRLVGVAYAIRDGGLKISKSDKPIKVKWHRELPSKPTSVTISRETDGKYYAAFICEYDPEPTNGVNVIGLDMGLKSIIADSNGDDVVAPKFFRTSEKKLRKAQKALSRKQKGSNNRKKARLKVAKLHAKTKHQRSDFTHKLSRELVNNSKLIAIETLNIKGMSKNRHLSKSIMDLGWSAFVQQLGYKVAESQWCSLVFIDRWYPSTQRCSNCDHRLEGSDKLTLKQRFWTCPSCQTKHDRDTNAAVNIRNEGIRIREEYLKSNINIDGLTLVSEVPA